MKRFIAVMILIASTASAQWANWPVTGETNYTYYGIQSAYHSVSQLWYSSTERAQVSGASGSIILEWEVDAGTNLTYVTNDCGHVYTNLVLLTTNLSYSVSISNPLTNDISGKLIYKYTDLSGEHTATSPLPHLEQDKIMYLIDAWVHDGSQLGRFVVTNLSTDDGLFDDFFSQTDGAGDHPQALPNYTMASLQYYNGFGYGRNYTTNAWGNVVGSTVTNDRAQVGITRDFAWFTHYPSNAVNWELAELIYDGANWNHRNLSTLGKNGSYNSSHGSYLTNPGIKPVLLFQHGTNPIISRDVTIKGEVYKNDWTAASRHLKNASETISSTGTNICTEQWYNVTNMTTTAGTNKQDSYSVIYNDELVMYSEWGEWQRLYSVCLDERWVRNHALLWTDLSHRGVNTEWTADGTDNWYRWSGTGTSFALANDVYDADAPSVSLNDGAPGHSVTVSASTSGSVTNYTISGSARRSKPVALTSGAVTNYARKTQFYVAPAANGTFDDQGDDLFEDLYEYSGESVIGIGAMTGQAFYGSISKPTNIPEQPDPGTSDRLGWAVDEDILGVVRWDVESATHPVFRFQDE